MEVQAHIRELYLEAGKERESCESCEAAVGKLVKGNVRFPSVEVYWKGKIKGSLQT